MSHDAMPFEQRKRVDKMLRERHFLLDVGQARDNPKRVNFSVSGSTGNVYKLQLDLRDHRIECDCPDFERHAARHKVLCKHACFVLRRVLRQNYDDGRLCYEHPRRYLIHAMRAPIDRRVQALLGRSFEKECSEVINDAYLQRYRQSTGQSCSANRNSSGVCGSSGEQKRARDEQSEMLRKFGVGSRADWTNDSGAMARLDSEDCPVCFESFSAGERADETLVRCAVCCNFVHQTCLDEWLKSGWNRRCVFCRSELAYLLYKDVARAKKKQRKSQSSASTDTVYLNVADGDDGDDDNNIN